MKKYFVLAMFLSFTILFSQIQQDHNIFYYWDMDQWDNFNDGTTPWHDMDFFCDPKDGFDGYYWKLEIGNSNGLFPSKKLLVDSNPIIRPTWLPPTGEVAEYLSGDSYIKIPHGFMPTFFNIYFYEGPNSLPDEALSKENQSININSIYLFDLYILLQIRNPNLFCKC